MQLLSRERLTDLRVRGKLSMLEMQRPLATIACKVNEKSLFKIMEKFDHLFIQPRDYTKSFQFFTETLGWKVTYSHGTEEDAGRLSYLEYNDFKLVLAEDHDLAAPSAKPEIYRTKGRISIHFRTKDVDATFQNIKHGAHVIQKPENTHWGTRWFLVEDPDGNQFGWQGPAKG